MKKFLIVIFLLALLITAVFIFFSREKIEETHTHNLTYVNPVSPTCESEGNTEYWKCSDCHKLFSDADGKKLTSYHYTNIMPQHSFVNDACSVCDAELFEFKLSSDGSSYSISNINPIYQGDVIIPSSYNGLPVTEIDLPYYSFYSQIDSITIPDSITEIKYFSWNSSSYSFSQINVDENNPAYKSIDGNLYTKDGKTLLMYALKNPRTHFTVPDGVENIGDSAGLIFGVITSTDFSNLMSITIPESVKSYKNIFSSNDIVEIINHSDSINNANALLTHSENESKIINKDGFLFVTANNETNYLVKYVGNDTEITLPESYNGENYEIYDFAFAAQRELTSITIPDSVEAIGRSAFSDCSSLSKLTIGKSVKKIGHLPAEDNSVISSFTSSPLFINCISLSEIIVSPDNTEFKSIDGNLYTKNGKTLIKYATAKIEKQFTFPDTVETIEEQAFYSAYSLEKITFNESITKISSNAFSECIGLTEINLPDSITEIDVSAFSGCESIKKLTLNAKTVEMGAFAYCENLETVIIGDKVQSISSDTFYLCKKLKSVTFNDTEGWFLTENEFSTTVDVSNPEQNLTLFPIDTFNNYTLKKQ